MAASWPTSVADDAKLVVAVNNFSGSLNGAIDASTTTVVLVDASALPATGGYVTIGTEAIKFTGKSTNTLTGVTRGADNTTAATHANGSAVLGFIVADHHNLLKDEITAIETSLDLTTNRILTSSGTPGRVTAGPAGTSTTVLHGAAAGQPTYSAVDLAADITGTLPVGNGGTGQTSYTDGQLLIGNTSGNTLAKATLTAGNGIAITNGAGSITLASSPAWAYVSQSSTLNPAVLGSYYLLSGASFTITLPTAASVAGQGFRFQHNGTSITQVYTFATTSGQTIGGVASGSYALYTAGETLYLVSDGSNWQIVNHHADTDWSATAASTITAAGGNPTKGNSGVGTVDSIQWMRRGNMCVVRFRYKQSNATGAAAGTGNYQILIPGGITADTSVHNVTTSTSMPDTMSAWLLSTAGGNTAAANSFNGAAYLYDSTHFCISGDYQAANTGIWGSATLPFTVSAVVEMTATLEFSVSGWRP